MSRYHQMNLIRRKVRDTAYEIYRQWLSPLTTRTEHFHRTGSEVGVIEDFTWQYLWEMRCLYKHRCFKCRATQSLETELDMDHLFPRSKGNSLAGNCVLLCDRCNRVEKGDKSPLEFFTKEEREVLAIMLRRQQIIYKKLYYRDISQKTFAF